MILGRITKQSINGMINVMEIINVACRRSILLGIFFVCGAHAVETNRVVEVQVPYSRCMHPAENRQAARLLIDAYHEVAAMLHMRLAEEMGNVGDRRYYSPIHSAIIAVSQWRVVEAEDSLFEIVDYEIEKTTIPVGASWTSSSLYPAAAALVNLRVDSRKVIRSISAADKRKQRLLLAWVLETRVGSRAAAVKTLEDAMMTFHGVDERRNIAETIEAMNVKQDLIGAALVDSKGRK